MRAARRTVSNHFRRILLNYYPALGSNKPYWAFLSYLMFGTVREEETGHLLLPAVMVADMEGKMKDYNTKNYSAKRFIEKFQKDVQAFEYSNWRPQKTRTVTNIEWPDEIVQAIEQERHNTWLNTGRVYMSDGKPFTKRKQGLYRKEDKIQALQLMSNAKCKEASDLLYYMNHLPPNAFTKITDNIHEAIEIANTTHDKEHQLDMLRAFNDQCQPFYKPTRGSTRIYPINETMLNLHKDVRLALTKGWIECDLKYAQLAISAKVWNVEAVQKFLAEGNNPWQHLSTVCGIQLNDSNKKILKESLYALMYGAGKSEITKILKPVCNSRLFFSSPIIKAIWAAREEKLEFIKDEGEIKNCFGQLLKINDFAKGERSILAQLSQAYELKLLYPIVKLAMVNRGKRGFTLAIWQHDGFSFYAHQKQDEEKWKRVIKQAVDDAAKTLGIITELEIL